MTAGVTIQQARCLEAIKRLTAEHRHGCSPTVREIMAAVGTSSSGEAQRLLNQLRDRGAITWEPRRARSITVIEGPTIADMMSWPPEVLERVSKDLSAVLYARGVKRAIERADAIQAGSQ